MTKQLNGLQSYRIKIVESNEKGRGYFCRAGVLEASGAIVLFLHADTLLPKQWCQKVLETMADPRVGGGGFSTSFRTRHWFVSRLSKLYNLFSKIIREFWGDRAMFMRKDDLLPSLEQIQIPLMEDVEMSRSNVEKRQDGTVI